MEFLNQIQSPSDVKRLSEKELDALSAEIRGTIIETVSKNGGHLASNLGIVELTLALHSVFTFPEDSIVFDVGHQAYAHKLITGRRSRFSTLRQGGGLSGFTNREESEYDAMTAGHSGASLSYAVGIAEANRIAKNGAYTIAVIGDGSFTNGMIYEAMNNAASHKLRLIIVLNDNEMSISPNVGALSRYFSRMRTSEAYFAFKLGLKRFFSAIPLVGKGLTSGARRIKEFFKRLLITETLFENMGLEYYGPVSGDDIGKLRKVLTEAKKQAAEHGAVVVHVNTKKGKGYKPAEDFPSHFHSTGPFSTEDIPKPKKDRRKNPNFTEAFSDVLLEEADKDNRICAVTAAMTDGCGLGEFRKRYPDRFFDVGIAEEHAVTFAGGLASRGMKPVITIYSTFMQRVFDQVWHDVALQNANAVFVLSHSGVVPGDGVTHQGIYDVSLLSPIPGIRIYSPDTSEELKKAFSASLKEKGAAVVRYAKGQGAGYDEEAFQTFDGGKIKRFGEGKADFLAVTYGKIAENLYHALEEYTKKTGKTAAMVVLTRIVPMNTEAFRDLTEEAERIFFVEEGIRTGGIAEQFAVEAAEKLSGKPVRIRAIEEGFLPHGTIEELYRRVGMDTESLIAWLTET